MDSKRSEIQQMINATNAQYIKELSVISEETLNKDKLGLVKDQGFSPQSSPINIDKHVY